LSSKKKNHGLFNDPWFRKKNHGLMNAPVAWEVSKNGQQPAGALLEGKTPIRLGLAAFRVITMMMNIKYALFSSVK
jgi:hypothetical protein